MEEHKFLIYGRSMAFIAIVTSCLLIIGALIVIIFNVIVGCCFLAAQLAITACILYFNPIFIVFNVVNVKESKLSMQGGRTFEAVIKGTNNRTNVISSPFIVFYN